MMNGIKHTNLSWLLTLCLLCTIHLAASTGEYLLPGDVTPTHYDIRFVYDIDPTTNYSFYGVVDILLRAKRLTSKIVLHAQGFHISDNKIRLTRGNSQVDIVNVNSKDTYNKLTIALGGQMVQNENYILTIPFYGNLKREFDGTYISNYINAKTKETEYLIVTQYEPLEARKGFPCFDEPNYKATFRISIGHHRNYSAISNMPIVKSSEQNALEDIWPWHVIENTFRKSESAFVFDQFDVTVPMSTYLVAYVVSKFTYRESLASLSTAKFRTWSRSDAFDQTSYAAIIGPKILTHYEKWFNVSYPLPKLDMIAVPDFLVMGMENWGLITYREEGLLYDKEQTPLSQKGQIAEVIAHELAHQWFGNLVTMKWWSDLWLNEGFATFVASVGVAAVEPTWHANRSYAVNNILSVLSLDALESSHPVSVSIDDPNRILELFDAIAYSKGTTLIRMMTMFLGEKVFRQGIHNYLIKYSYQNAEQDDLWQMLTEVSQKHGGLTRKVTVKEIMDTWTTQTGYPLLTVTRDYNDSSLTITQKRYISLSMRTRTVSSWWVPLTVLSEGESGDTPLEWLAREEGTSRPHRYDHDAKKDQWLLFNSDMIAPYRVSYDQQNWKLLSSTLRSPRYTDIPVLGRVQLMSDAFALAWTNHLGYDTTIELSSYLSRETDVLPLTIGLNGLSSIGVALKRTVDFGIFQKYMRKLVEVAYRRSGGLASKNILNDDNLESVKKQVLLSKCACLAKVQGCEENAMELFQRWMDTRNPDENNPIPLELRTIVYSVAISRGSETQWNFALARMQNANSPSSRTQLLYSLGKTRELWIIAQFLEMCITDGSEIRHQDASAGIAAVLSSDVGYYIAKDFVYDRIEDIYNFVDGQGNFLGAIISVLLNEFTSQKELDEFMVWRENNSKYLEPTKLVMEQVIETAKVKIDWINMNRRLVVEKLRQFSTEHDEKNPLRMRSFHAQTQLINKAVILLTSVLLYIYEI